jgi:nitrous oxide reductase accessory protein NosL
MNNPARTQTVMVKTPTRRIVAHLRRGLVSIAALLISGCGGAAGGPPEIILDRTACDHCLMLISDPAYSAALQIDSQMVVFDDIGCLLAKLAEEDSLGEAQVWVHDIDSGRWLSAADAVFVRSSQISTPMASGIVAVEDHAAATELASQREGEIFATLRDLLDQVTETEVKHADMKDGSHGQ